MSSIRCLGYIFKGNVFIVNTRLTPAHFIIGHRNYSKDKDSDCCKEIKQTTGRKVESWPKTDPINQLTKCPQQPQPPNYDPYRIKVPDAVVPPLPRSNAKDLPNDESIRHLSQQGINYTGIGMTENMLQDMFQNSPIMHPNYWKEQNDKRKKKLSVPVLDPIPKLGYHGQNKYKYAFHEPWKPLDRLTLLAAAEKRNADADTQTEEIGQTVTAENIDKQIS